MQSLYIPMYDTLPIYDLSKTPGLLVMDRDRFMGFHTGDTRISRDGSGEICIRDTEDKLHWISGEAVMENDQLIIVNHLKYSSEK